MKTKAVRRLESLGITPELREYVFDPDAMSAGDVARKINMPPEQVFKTLLCRLDTHEYVFAVVPGNAELFLKKLALAAGVRKAELASLKELEPVTGYIRGGVTALATKKELAAFADESIHLFDCISVSAGMRGLQMVLATADYLRLTSAVVADLTRALLD